MQREREEFGSRFRKWILSANVLPSQPIQDGFAKSNFDWRVALLTSCLRLGTFLCFAGWAWAHLYWEPSYSSLLWSDATFEWFQNRGYSWEDFAGTGANDGLVQQAIRWIGWLFVAGAVLSLTARRKSWIQLGLLSCSSLVMLGVAIAKYVKAEFELPMLIEHGGQILCPLLLVLALSIGARHWVTVYTAVVAVVLTFAGHGLYAVGLWPTPTNFVAMTRVILGWSTDSSLTFLLVAGILDFVVCLGLLMPFTRRATALYGFVWGVLTAAARPVAGMSWELNYWGADQFLHESVLRAPHFLIPLFLLLFWTFSKTETESEPLKAADNQTPSL